MAKDSWALIAISVLTFLLGGFVSSYLQPKSNASLYQHEAFESCV